MVGIGTATKKAMVRLGIDIGFHVKNLLSGRKIGVGTNFMQDLFSDNVLVRAHLYLFLLFFLF